MRVPCVLAVLFLAAASAFEVGKDYVYHYNGKLQIFNPEQPLQSSGFAFRSKVVAQPRPDHTHFKISDFEVDSFNGEHVHLSDHEFHYHSTDALKQFIERPFAGKFSEGKLEEIELGKNEPKWSRNMKQAVLSVFQLDLVKGRHENPHAKQFYVREDGLHGNCDTLYVVGEKEGHLKVTKIKNLEKCDKEHYAVYGRIKGHECVHCQAQETHPLVATSQVKYRLDGTPEHYVINHACATSETVFRPFGAGKTFVVQINRTLDLEEVHAANVDTQLPEDVEKLHHLEQVFPESHDVESLEDLRKVNRFVVDYELSSEKDKFVAGFNHLAAFEYEDGDVKDVHSKESGGINFIVLFHLFATLPFEDVTHAYEEVVTNAPEAGKAHARRLFLDLLSAVGTNPHVAFGLQLVKEDKLDDDEAEHFLTKLALNLKENSPALLTELAEVCEHVKPRRHVWVNCQLALSTLAGQEGCVRAKTEKEHDEGFCKPSLVSHFFNYSITPSHKEDQPEYKKTVYLKAAGNLATRDAVHYLERFIDPEAHQPEYRRAAALWALKHSGHFHPELVRDIALPVYKNKSESSYLRIAAFVNVLSTNPDLYLLKYIGHNIIDDPSDQLASYVTSTFRALVKSKYPCHQEVAQHLRYVVPMWDDVERFAKPLDHTKSQTLLSSGYDAKYDYGGLTAFGQIRADDSYLPRNMYFGVKDYFGGHSFDTLSVWFESWGLDKLLNQVVGPQPGSTKNLWNVFGRRRFTRDASAKELKEVEDALHVTDREYDHVYGRLNLNLFGHAIDTWEFDESLLQELSKGEDAPGEKLKNLLGKVQRKKSFYLSKDIIFVMPSELGVPVFFDWKQVEFTYMNRKKFALDQTEDAKFALDLQRHYVHESRGYSMFGVALTFNKTSLGTASDMQTIVNLPLDLHLTVDPIHKKLSMRRPLSLPWNIVNHHFRPYTFTMPYEMSSHDIKTAVTMMSHPHHPLYNKEEVTEFDRTYFQDFLGYGLNVKGSLLSQGLKKGLHDFWYESDSRQRFYYATLNPEWHPRELTFTVVPAEHDVTTEVEVDLGYKFLEPDDARESHFPVHDNVGGDAEVPSTHVLSLDYTLKGSKERKASAELRYSFTKDNLKHKVQFFYDRTPFHSKESDHTKVCLDVETKFPAPHWERMKNLAVFHEGQELESHLNLRYGSNCEDQSSITFNGKYEHTDDEENQIRENAEGKPLGTNRLKKYSLRLPYNKCVEHQKRGVHLNYYCMKYLYYTSRLGKFTTDVEYKNLKPLVPKLLAYYKKVHPEGGFLSTVTSHIHGPNGKFHVVSQVPPVQKYTDIVVTTEDGRTYHHDHVPTFSHLLEPRIFSVLGYSNMVNYISYYKQKYCDLQSKTVRTFDNVVVHLPETDCFKVVAKDCSPNKRFLVLARATGNAALPKALKAFIQSTKVELLPVSDDGGLVLRIDGNKVDITPGVPYSHTAHDVELFTVTQHDKYFEVMSQPYGLFLGFDGNALFVQTANFYRGKLCGLCGDYNYDRQHELVGPDLHHYNDTLEFAKSYVVPASDCTLH